MDPSLWLSKTTVPCDSSYCEREAEGPHCIILGSPGFSENDSTVFYNGLKAFPLLCYITHSSLQVCLVLCGSQPQPEPFMQLHSRRNTTAATSSFFRLAWFLSKNSLRPWCCSSSCFSWELPLTPFKLEPHHVQFTVSQLTAHLDSCNVYQQCSLVPTYCSLSVNNVALYCCLHWDE